MSEKAKIYLSITNGDHTLVIDGNFFLFRDFLATLRTEPKNLTEPPTQPQPPTMQFCPEVVA